MSHDPTITCPNCRTDIRLTESLAAPLVEATRKRFEAALADKERAMAGREEAIRAQAAGLARDTAALEEQLAKRLGEERSKIAAEESRKAKAIAANDLGRKDAELSTLQEVLKDRDRKLADAQKVEIEVMRQKRELDDQRREMDLTVERKVQDELVGVREKAKEEAEGGLRLKVQEKEEQIASMQRQIEELRRKAEQGSQQLQGEALELEMESLLRARFARDRIEPIAKGEFGGDAIQRVVGPSGQDCGSILWESKRTKNWSDLWLAKLRDDQRAAKAAVAILVSQALPKGVTTFDLVDGVWVTAHSCAIPVAIALRQSLIEIAAARQAGQGQGSKMELVYAYLTGPRFRQRVEAIVEKFTDMRDDLDRERKTMTRLWAKREIQIQGVIDSTVGLYGDLQGIAGGALEDIEALSLPSPCTPAQEAAE